MKKGNSLSISNDIVIINNKKKPVSIGQVILISFLGIMGVVMLLPFYWSVIASFTDAQALEGAGFHLFYGSLTLNNWTTLIQSNWGLYILNTVFISFMEIFLSLFFCSMSAYVMAKYDFYGKKTLYRIMLISMMLPGIITLIPQFIVVCRLPLLGGNDALGENTGTTINDVGPGLINSLWGVILPNAVSIYGILFLKQFFTNLSDEIGDAARIDGASEFRIFLIYLKMALPGVTTLGLFTFVANWNSYLWPSMILYSQNKFTLGIALQEFQTTATTGEMMAGSLLSIVPMVVLFLFTQKYFMKDTKYTGIK